MNLEKFRFSIFQFDLQFKSEDLDGHYLHNIFRGVLGNYLLQFTCFCHNKKKHDTNCVYKQVFEPSQVRNELSRFNVETSPRPFVFNITQVKGIFVRIEFILLGEAVKYFSHIYFCIYKMGKEGLGKNKNTFRIIQLFNNGKNIQLADNELIRQEYSNHFRQSLFKPNFS